MDLSIARSIYERAKAVKRSKNAADAEIVSNEYQAFQIANPYLPYVAPYVALNHYGSKIKILSSDDEVIIDAIIAALRPLFLDSNGNDFFIGKLHKDVGCLKAPITMKILKNQESVRCIEKQYLEKTKTKELSLFLDSILKEAKFMETEWLEFKTILLKDRYDYLGKIFSSLSNTARLYNLQYAYLIYGINEPKREISGTNFSTSSNIWQVIEQELHQRFTPSIKFEILEFNYNDDSQKHIVIFRIHAASDTPISYCGNVFVRKGDSTVLVGKKAHFTTIKTDSSPQHSALDNSESEIIQKTPFFLELKISAGITIDLKVMSDKRPLLILVALVVITIGFIKKCYIDEKNVDAISVSVNLQNKSSEQGKQIYNVIYGDNNNIFNSNGDGNKQVAEKKIDNNNAGGDSDVENPTIAQSSSSVQEESSSSMIKKRIKLDLDDRRTVCTLYEGADTIVIHSMYAAGLLNSLIADYNDFAVDNGLKTYENNYEKYDNGGGSINNYGVSIHSSIKRTLKNIIDSNKMKCK